MFKATISVIFSAFFLGATIHPSPTTTTDACPYLQNSHHDGAQLAEAGHEGRRCHQGAAAQRASVPNGERMPAETWSRRSIQQRQLQTSGGGLSGLFDFLFGWFFDLLLAIHDFLFRGGGDDDGDDNDPPFEGTVQEALDAAREDIQNIMNAPKFVRLAFHDCVGGCDGCVGKYHSNVELVN